MALAVTDDVVGPMTVTSNSTVYGIPLPVEVTVSITGIVCPMSEVGGSTVTSLAAETRAQVALVDVIVSAAFLKYCATLTIVFVLAGTVTASVGEDSELVVVRGAEVDEVEGPTTVTRSSIVYGMPETRVTVNMTGMV